MSQASSSRRVGRLLLVATVAAAVGCTRQIAAPIASPPPGAEKVGYVRMDDLVKVHPLYPQLAHLDEDMEALQLKSVGPQIAVSASDIAAQERALEKQLADAADATNKALQAKQQDYQKREQEAINAALAAAGVAGGPSGAQIAGGIGAVGSQQAGAAAAAAQANFEAYRKQLIAQRQKELQQVMASLNASAERSYHAKAAELSGAEADYAYKLAQDDSAQRLALRTKLTNLPLDDASRDDIKKQLDALDKQEADELAAMKNRDEATLVAYQKDLHAKTQAKLDKEVAALRAQTDASLNKRYADTKAMLAQAVAPPGGPGAAVAVPAGVSPELRAKIQALHDQFAADYKQEAQATIAQFQKTRSNLQKRFADLAGADGAAQAGAAKEYSALQKQRGDLYDQMVAQIGREVKTVAARRGVTVVVGAVVAPGDGVDLTSDAEKDIESLHE